MEESIKRKLDKKSPILLTNAINWKRFATYTFQTVSVSLKLMVKNKRYYVRLRVSSTQCESRAHRNRPHDI